MGNTEGIFSNNLLFEEARRDYTLTAFNLWTCGSISMSQAMI